MTPTARTLALLRAEGWTCGVVEQTIPHTFIKRDLGGFLDIVAWAPGRGVMGIQATSGSNVASRVDKIRALPSADAWLRSGARLEVWGWRKAGDRGKRKTWQVTVERVLSGDPTGD